jgi:hypothetical protein
MKVGEQHVHSVPILRPGRGKGTISAFLKFPDAPVWTDLASQSLSGRTKRWSDVHPVHFYPIQAFTPASPRTDGCPSLRNRNGSRPYGMLIQRVNQDKELTAFVVKRADQIHILSI